MSLSHPPAPPGTLAVEMRDVTVISLRHPAQRVLEEVNWEVRVGEYWAVAGLIRSGKSDLLSLAAGLTSPACGRYRLFGEELIAGFEEEQMPLRMRMGLVFDGGQLLQPLTLAENIALPLHYHPPRAGAGLDVASRLQALIEFTGLADWIHRFPPQVTRNWQQRIGLARALALRPEILFLDNPLTGLDPRDSTWWLETLSALTAGHPILEGHPVTLVVTGDNLSPWRDRATHFALLKDHHFMALGVRGELSGHSEPLLHELSPGFQAGS